MIVHRWPVSYGRGEASSDQREAAGPGSAHPPENPSKTAQSQWQSRYPSPMTLPYRRLRAVKPPNDDASATAWQTCRLRAVWCPVKKRLPSGDRIELAGVKLHPFFPMLESEGGIMTSENNPSLVSGRIRYKLPGRLQGSDRQVGRRIRWRYGQLYEAIMPIGYATVWNLAILNQGVDVWARD